MKNVVYSTNYARLRNLQWKKPHKLRQSGCLPSIAKEAGNCETQSNWKQGRGWAMRASGQKIAQCWAKVGADLLFQ